MAVIDTLVPATAAKRSTTTRDVSVVMINRNGGEYLSRALESLKEVLERSPAALSRAEFILVDNASTDDSVEAASRILRNASIPSRVVVERQLGVNSARNRAIAEAATDLIVLVDSDLTFAPGWLDAYLDAADRFPEALVFGGRVSVGDIEGSVPKWLDVSGPWKRSNIVVQLELEGGVGLRLIRNDEGPVGPNMAFRRELFRRVGDFDTRYGLRPGSLVAGAEAEFFDRIARQSTPFCWVPSARVYHPIRANQLTRKYFLKRLHGIGRVASRLANTRGEETGHKLFGLTLYRVRELLEAVAAWIAAEVAKDPKEAFYRRGTVSIFCGYLHEDFSRWRSR